MKLHKSRKLVCVVVFFLLFCCTCCLGLPAAKEYTNSIGMKLVRIEPGEFQMGQVKTPIASEILPLFRGRGRFDGFREGDFDEKPIHTVRITQPFYMGVYEVTNFQYEIFDPGHKKLRGDEGLSNEDDEAVVNVSWYDAQRFCRWLSDKEGLPYRLATEAEWEYACRAGSNTNYHTGDVLPKEMLKYAYLVGRPKPVPLKVGQHVPNSWGIYDMHGNVEEWCNDWYGPYKKGLQIDPGGRAEGDFRVTRGASWCTPEYFMRSANRMASLPEDKHCLIGFRVVVGKLPETTLLKSPPPQPHQLNVISRDSAIVNKGPDPAKPYFKGPLKFVNIPTEENGPVFAQHNHDPAIVECPNGDLLTIWYTCISEGNRELSQAASRLRWGSEKWEKASPFWDVPDRNDAAPALWFDGKDKIYHFSGLAFAGGYYYNTMIQRTSTDCGATWSRARIIVPGYNRHGRSPSEPIFRMHDGSLALVVDDKGSSVWISPDEGLTWSNPGGNIKGIHAGVVQLKDGSLYAFGRGEGGTLPRSISTDGGKTYTFSGSEFPPVGGGQRIVLMRLKEGPIFLAGFADTGIMIKDASGTERQVHGMYTALSLDEGKTWPYKRLVTDDGPGKQVECTDGGLFIMGQRSAEFRGYMAGCQSADGLIHLISSRQHYAFNLKWLMTPSPALKHPEVPVQPVVETFSGPKKFDADGWVDYHSYLGEFNGKGQFRIESLSHHSGIHRIIGKGSFEINIKIDNINYYESGTRVSEGVAIWFTDARARSMSFAVKENGIVLSAKDRERDTPLPGGRKKPGEGWRFSLNQAEFSQPPKSIKMRFIWNKPKKQMRTFYGLNGKEPTIELQQSKEGISFGRPFSDSTAIYLLMSNGTIEVDHFEIKRL
ncbi:MAG: SUMF1/EgtB/PvdO family nonheme iron enzyme [Planctomycetota bacterium]